MKTLLIFILCLACYSCEEVNNQELKKLDRFNQSLGDENSKILNHIVNSMDSFILMNYPNEENLEKATKLFLADAIQFMDSFPKTPWKFIEPNHFKLENQFEKSNLKNEIWYYIKSGYDTENPNKDSSGDSSRWFNLQGKFFNSIEIVSEGDSSLIEYVDSRKRVINFSPQIALSAYLNGNHNLSNPILRRTLAIDFYYDLIQMNNRKIRHANNGQKANASDSVNLKPNASNKR